MCGRCADRNSECIWKESRRGYRDYRSSNDTDTSSRYYSTLQPPASNTFLLDQDTIAAQTYTFEQLFDPSLAQQQNMDVQAYQNLVPSPSDSGSTTSVARSSSPSLLHCISEKESTDLIDDFYRHFHPAHPFIVPKKLYKATPSVIPEHLKAVMRFAASNYVSYANSITLGNAASVIFSERISEDGFKVQALLLFAIISFARNEEPQAGRALVLATEVALRIGMNRQSFASNHSNDPTVQESWRRTWWQLFIVNGIVTAMDSQEHPFDLHDAYCDVPLPGPCEDYANCVSEPHPRSMSQFRDRTFSEDPYSWSSFAYSIEAMYIMAAVSNLGYDTFAITDPQVEAVDASISNYLLSLPPSKREVTQLDGRTDEMLLTAHMIINWAAILVHRPRSSLTFIRNHYHTTCTPRREVAGLPGVAYASHTAKTLRAANALISLASIPRPLTYSSPVLMCGITIAATVHLPAYAIADHHDTAVAIKERLQLAISALGALAEIWPRASISKSQVAKFAREILTTPSVSVDSTGVGMVPLVTEESSMPELDMAGMPQLDYGMGFNETAWMDSIIHMYKEESELSQEKNYSKTAGRSNSKND